MCWNFFIQPDESSSKYLTYLTTALKRIAMAHLLSLKNAMFYLEKAVKKQHKVSLFFI